MDDVRVSTPWYGARIDNDDDDEEADRSESPVVQDLIIPADLFS